MGSESVNVGANQVAGAVVSPVEVGSPGSSVLVGDGRLTLVCGPCVIESRQQILEHAQAITEIARELKIQLVFKSSFDKANRTSNAGFRGVGIHEGLAILAEVRERYHVPIVTDIHSAEQASLASQAVDMLQIPAFLCRQTDLLLAAGATGKVVMIKKGQFLAPEDMQFAADKVKNVRGSGVILCERGTCFGYRDLVVDYRSLVILRDLGYPVVFDATHSVQKMGGGGGKSSGDRRYVPALARAAVAVGVDGVFIESHFNPDAAPSDGPNMLPVSMLKTVLQELLALATCCNP